MRNLLLLFITIFTGFYTVNAQDAKTILAKVDKTVFSVKDKTATVEMQMINLKTNTKKIKKAMLYQKGLDKKLFRYTYPKSDNGIASLTLPDAVYLYLPMFKKPKKITNMAESNKFNKSDFSLEDRDDKTYTERYTPNLIKSDADTYILNLVPKKPGGSYSRLLATVNKHYYYPEKIEYFDQDGNKLKIATYTFKKIGKYWVATEVSMENVVKKHKTRFIMTDIKFNTGLKDDLFTPEKMAGE
jgi:outer membrane lipoprotein-sorting protein